MADLKMPSVNSVVISGRMTRDPEVKYLPSGSAVCNMGLASGRWYKDKAGEFKEVVAFVDVTAWEKLGELCGEKLSKGSAVLVEGRVTSRSWETQDGQRRSKVEVVANRIQFLDKDGSSSGPARDTGPDLPADDLPF